MRYQRTHSSPHYTAGVKAVNIHPTHPFADAVRLLVENDQQFAAQRLYADARGTFLLNGVWLIPHLGTGPIDTGRPHIVDYAGCAWYLADGAPAPCAWIPAAAMVEADTMLRSALEPGADDVLHVVWACYIPTGVDL